MAGSRTGAAGLGSGAGAHVHDDAAVNKRKDIPGVVESTAGDGDLQGPVSRSAAR
jgi:hypothetical protein